MSTPSVKPDQYHYTMSEIAPICGVTEMNIRNWMARDIVAVGLKHKLGRWLFCAKDVVRLRVIGDLASIAGMPPTEANVIADAVVDRLIAITEVTENGESPFIKAGRQWERLRIFIYKDGDEVLSKNFMGTADDYRWAPGSGSKYPWFNRPHLVIPADEICLEITLRLYVIDAADAGTPMRLESLLEENESGPSRREIIEKADVALDQVSEMEGLTTDKQILEALDQFATTLQKMKGDLIHRSEKGLRHEE